MNEGFLIKITIEAQKDLISLGDYIAFILGAPDSARGYISAIANEIKMRVAMT